MPETAKEKHVTLKAIVRVVKESGLTELFVTGTEPLMNWSTHLKGDVTLESGTYNLMFIPAEPAVAQPADAVRAPVPETPGSDQPTKAAA